ncbi:hypothetical protein MPER_09824 [Moniliophthora perniciosa FA553]|nr:hypothetical protein MPER_09824 [Moniliophthora perniciosa FA553]
MNTHVQSSVSIPAPVYYADIVCARAKNHYDPAGSVNLSDTFTSDSAEATLESYRQSFQHLHTRQQTLMYFSRFVLKVLENEEDKYKQ